MLIRYLTEFNEAMWGSFALLSGCSLPTTTTSIYPLFLRTGLVLLPREIVSELMSNLGLYAELLGTINHQVERPMKRNYM